ncbi:methyl-accepting chemotaxis protein [Sphingomonas sp. BK580]|uniref:methyl-accepting chemotaxis protein n=1 Tax=Sphingomonas sp. BK580 TaxID=2586972 RepID=UPI00161769E7|nr:methyl-accepting chemotaxis protein [Sphingomonas sp. BK580]MBB3692345.1 methyl-accepting chemotaxis protein [Sphingomonas sp. BK580]
MTSHSPSSSLRRPIGGSNDLRRDNIFKRSVTARLLTPLLGALALLWLLAALTWFAAQQVHDVNAAAAATQDRVVLLSEVRSLSRSLQRDALNLVTELDPTERQTILYKFATRSRTMRADLRTLQRGALGSLPPRFFMLSDRVVDALRAVARQAQEGDRAGALRRFHREVRPAERAASKVVDAEIDALTARTSTLRSDAAAVETRVARRLIAAVLLLTASGLVAGLIITRRSVILPLQQLRSSMHALAAGGAPVLVPQLGRSDEIGQMAQSLADLQRQLALAEAAKREQARQIVGQIGRALDSLARGDLSARVDEAMAGEFAKLGADLNTAMLAVGAALATVRSSAAELATSADSLRGASDDLARRTEGHAASLATTATAVHEITQTVQETANLAGLADAMVAEARADAEQMGGTVGRATEAMRALERSSAEIGEIISVIDGFAFQTSLLALNAGIEAARAGNAGLGFAVVASEVRALAQRSADAAHDVKARITGSIRQVDLGVSLVAEAGNALARIKARVIEAADLVASISHAAREQSIGLQQVNDAVAQMDGATQDNVAMVQEATEAVRRLDSLVRTMTEQVDRFRLDAPTATPTRGGAVLRRS